MRGEDERAASVPVGGDWPSDRDEDKPDNAVVVVRVTAICALVGLASWVVDGSTDGILILMYVGAAAAGGVMATMLLTTLMIAGPDDEDGNEMFPLGGAIVGPFCAPFCVPWMSDVSSTPVGLACGFAGAGVLAALATACLLRSGRRGRPAPSWWWIV